MGKLSGILGDESVGYEQVGYPFEKSLVKIPYTGEDILVPEAI